MRVITRRHFLITAGLAATTAALAACSTGATTSPSSAAKAAPAASAGAFPVTISHAFGETTITQAPSRVVGIGWINGDILASLGIIPVAQAAVDWGGNANASTDWFDAKVAELGGTAPTRFSEADGINYAAVAAANPDLIVNVIGRLDADSYAKLSKIAPVVTYTEDGKNWTTSWQDATRTIGRATGRAAQADQVIAAVEAEMAQVTTRFPALAGATFLAGNINPTDGTIGLYSPKDVRPRFLTDIGLVPAPVMETIDFPADSFYTKFSAERADELASDLFYTWAEESNKEDLIRQHPLLRTIPAVSSGGLFVDPIKAQANAFGTSPLAIPWLLNSPFMDSLAAHAAAARK